MRVGQRLGQQGHRDRGRRTRQRARRALAHLPGRRPQRSPDRVQIGLTAAQFAQRGQGGRAHQRVGIADQRAHRVDAFTKRRETGGRRDADLPAVVPRGRDDAVDLG